MNPSMPETTPRVVEQQRLTDRDSIEPMDPIEFRKMLVAIGWRTGDLAWVLRIDVRVASRWANGGREVPLLVGHWLRILAERHVEFPLPEGWRVEIDDGEGSC